MEVKTIAEQIKGITVQIGGDTTGLDKALKNVRKETGSLQSELKRVDQLLKLDPGNTVLLSQKMDILAESAEKVKNNHEALTEAKEELDRRIAAGEVEVAAEQYRLLERSVIEADNRHQALTEQLGQTQKALEGSKNATEELGKKTNETADNTLNFGNIAKQVFASIGINIDDAIDTATDAFDEYKKTLGETNDDTSEKAGLMGSVINTSISAGVAAAVAAIGEIALAVSEAADEVELESDRIQTALNLTEEEAAVAEDSVLNVYAKGLLSREEAQRGVIDAMKMMKVSAEEAEEIVNMASAVSVGHGQDLKEVIQTASTLMSVFGLSAQESMDLLAGAFDTSAGKFDDLLGALNEYAPRAQEIGYSAADMITAISNAADAGAVSADKSLDILKETYNKAAGATDEYKEALKELGLNSTQTIERLTGGGEIARLEMDRMVSKLADMQDESERARLAGILLGTQWEDTSIDIAAAVTSSQESVSDFAGAASEDFETLTNNNATAVEQMTRTWETKFTSLKDGLLRLFFMPVMTFIDSIKKGASEIQKFTGGTSTTTRGHAKGTLSAPRGLAWVGEEGPELVDFRGGERVYTATQSRAMAASASGSLTQNQVSNYYVTIDAKNVREWNDVVRALGRRGMEIQKGVNSR